MTENNQTFERFSNLQNVLLRECEPSLWNIPHFVVPNGRPIVAIILDAVGSPGGVWGRTPPYAPDGGPFFFNSQDPYSYRAWGNPINQEWLYDQGVISNIGSTYALFDISTKDNVFDMLNSYIEENCIPLFDDLVGFILHNIKSFKWVYVLADEDSQFGIFFVDYSCLDIFTKLKITLRARKIDFWHIAS